MNEEPGTRTEVPLSQRTAADLRQVYGLDATFEQELGEAWTVIEPHIAEIVRDLLARRSADPFLRCRFEARAIARAIARQLAQSCRRAPSRLLVVVRLSSEWGGQAVRYECSFAKKRESPTALLVVVRDRRRPIGSGR